jgi:nucleolar complex protein 2
VFIPLAPYIFEVFESSEVKKKGKTGTLKPLEWDVYIRTPKQFLHTKVYQVSLERSSMIQRDGKAENCTSLY